MTFEQAKRVLSNTTDEGVERALATTESVVTPPELCEYTEYHGGRYNTVALPVKPFDVVSVEDESDEPLDFELWGPQQVRCTRDLCPPVTVEYVTKESQAEYERRFRKELERRG